MIELLVTVSSSIPTEIGTKANGLMTSVGALGSGSLKYGYWEKREIALALTEVNLLQLECIQLY